MLPPPSWRQLQEHLAQALTTRSDLGKSVNLGCENLGLTVHRNNIVHGQADALAHVFPVFQQLVGEECFFAVIKDFFRDFPPSSPCLAEHGVGLARFVQDLPFARSMPWLVDMIRLEWALYCALHAAEDDGCDPQALVSRPLSELDSLVFTFHPSVSFLPSSWPINAIRLAHQAAGDEPDFSGISLDSGPEYMAVFRDCEGAQVIYLDTGAFVFLNNCYKGLTLAAAAEDVMASEAETVFSDYLTLALMKRWIVGVKSSGGS